MDPHCELKIAVEIPDKVLLVSVMSAVAKCITRCHGSMEMGSFEMGPKKGLQCRRAWERNAKVHCR